MPRTAASAISLTFFNNPRMTLIVDAYTVKRSDAGTTISATMVCPSCEVPTKLRQEYTCDEHGSFANADMARAIDVNGALTKVDAETLAAAKAEGLLPDKRGEVKWFPAEAVTSQTRPGANVYRLGPAPQGTKTKRVPEEQATLYSLFADAIEANPDKVAAFEMTLRGIQRMFRLDVWNGDLILQELLRPGEFNDFDSPERVGYDNRLLATVNDLAEATVEEFVPNQYENFYRERADALALQVGSGETPTVAPAAAVTTPDEDLLSALTASIEMAKPKPKAKAKKAPAKAS